MKFLKKIIKLAFFLILIYISIISVQGYFLYKNATNKISLSQKISQIQKSENFTTYSNISKNLIDSTVAVEDHRFMEHGPIDVISITRAIFSNIKAKDAVEGGSTITQQVAKNLYFMENKEDPSRKIAELILSYNLEKNYSKEEIFELYVNTIYYGNGYYGIKSATNGYMKKDPKELTLTEATMLAGVPNAPSVYAPTSNLELCQKRQKKVIQSLVKYNYLTQEEANKISLYK